MCGSISTPILITPLALLNNFDKIILFSFAPIYFPPKSAAFNFYFSILKIS